MKAERQNFLAVHLSRSLCEARCDYRRRWKRCRKKISEKAVHDLRVDTRRLLALLEFLEEAPAGGLPGKLKKLLKKRLDASDELRDTHVQLELLQPLWPRFPEARPLRKFLRRHEQKLIKKIDRKLERGQPAKLISKLKSIEKKIGCAEFASKSPADEREVAGAALQKSFDCVFRLRRRIHGKDPRAIHQMRVAFKRLRYLSELLQPFLPWVTKDVLRRMKKFQALAGDIQDLEILLARIEALLRKKKFSAEALRSLRNELSRRKHRAMDVFLKQIDELLKFRPKVSNSHFDFGARTFLSAAT